MPTASGRDKRNAIPLDMKVIVLDDRFGRSGAHRSKITLSRKAN
jgi:hypothetical protein